jgi:predicted DNA-binding protein with PD1-like motif
MQGTRNLLEGVGSGRLDRVVFGKVPKDTSLLDGIAELVKKEGVRTGVILSAVGALKKATFRNLKIMPPDFKVEKHHRLYLELERPMEIVSLTGWIATGENGETEIHAHFSASTVMEDHILTFGGHLTPETLTSIKVVVVIGVIEDTDIRAAMDPRINQIDVKLHVT